MDAVPARNLRTAEEILAHPRFSEARQQHCRGILELYRNRSFSQIYMSASRNVICAVLICQYAAHDPADRSTWPTLGHLQDTAERFQLSGRRMVEHFVGRLKQVGYVEEVPAPSDRRAKLLKPTEAMLAHDRQYTVALFAPLMTLFPHPDYLPAITMDPEFHLSQRMVGMSLMGQAQHVIDRHRALMALSVRDAASGVLLWLVDAVHRAGVEPLKVSTSELGEMFSVSRTHIRSVLHGLERLGFIALCAPAGELCFEVRPALFAAFDSFLADVLASQDLIAQLVKALPRGAPTCGAGSGRVTVCM